MRMRSNHRIDFSGHDLGAGVGHIVPIQEIQEYTPRKMEVGLEDLERATDGIPSQEEGYHYGFGEESLSPTTLPRMQPQLTTDIPSTNPEDSILYHWRMRTLQTPVGGSSRANRNATTNWRAGVTSVQSNPWRRIPSMKNLLHRFSSKFWGSALDAMMTERSQRSLSSVEGGSSHQLSSLPVTKIIASPQLLYSLPVMPMEKEASNRRGDSIFRVIPSALGLEKYGITSSENEVSVEGEDIPIEEAMCRICFRELGEGGESMKLHCSCKGDPALAHRECAIQWFSVEGNKNCQFCKQEVQNLPVMLLRLRSTRPSNTACERDPEAAASMTFSFKKIRHSPCGEHAHLLLLARASASPKGDNGDGCVTALRHGAGSAILLYVRRHGE